MRAGKTILVLAVALALIACRANAETRTLVESLSEPFVKTNTTSGDAPTSPAPPGSSSRAARPPGPGAVHPPFEPLADAPTEWWRVYFYAGAEPAGEPLAISAVPELHIDMPWEKALPAAELAASPQSCIWVRNVELKGGAYRVYLWADGHVGLWVNGRPVLDEREADYDTALIGDLWLDRAGPAELLIIFQPAGPGARLKLWWEPVGWFSAWRGEYYPNRYLTGQPVIVRNDAAPVFDWGLNAPALGLPHDEFSVRWTRTLSLPGGCYRFVADAEGGVRVYVDEALLINAWNETVQDPVVREIALAPGEHTLTVEYFNAEGPAAVSVTWERIGSEPDDCVASTAYPPSATNGSVTRSGWAELQATLWRWYQRIVGPAIWW